MKTFKKLVASLLSVVLLAGMCAANVFAAETDTSYEELEPPVSIDSEKTRYVSNGKYLDVYLTINDTATSDLEVDISYAILSAIRQYSDQLEFPWDTVMGGNRAMVHVTISNQSDRTYTYDSFVLSPPEPVPYWELSPFFGFDGQQLPLYRIGTCLYYCDAIYKGLFGLSSDKDVTADMMFGIYDTLAEKGYTGENAMTDYMLDYYNQEYGLKCDSWKEMADAMPYLYPFFANSGSHTGLAMTYEQMEAYCEEYPELAPYVTYQPIHDGYDNICVQIKWPEEELATFSYNGFYQDFFAVAYGDECEKLIPDYEHSSFVQTRGLGDYMDPNNALHRQTDAYFAGLKNADVFAPGESLSFTTKLAIDDSIGFGYSDYPFSYNNFVFFKEIDTSFWNVVHKYYTSTDGGKYILDGTVTGEAITGRLGGIIKATDVEKLPKYNGNSYTFYRDSGDIELVADASENQIVIEYRREVKTQVDPKPEDPNNSGSSEKPENPATGDTQLPMLCSVAVLLTLGLACVLSIRKRIHG